MPPFSEQDPLLFDSEQIQALAGPEIVRSGLRHFRENRVTSLDWDAGSLWADVEDEETEDVVSVELAYDADGNLHNRCGCDPESDQPCSHAVAALFAYGARGETAGEIKGAAESAIGERVKRGRAEVSVQHISGEFWYGTWSARSIASSSHFPVSYRVHIRSIHRRANYCTCPDFATNELGTCKHVEAVLHRIKKQRGYKRMKDLRPPSPYVYLDWDSSEAPQIRLHRGAEASPELGALLDDFFDTSGSFIGAFRRIFCSSPSWRPSAATWTSARMPWAMRGAGPRLPYTEYGPRRSGTASAKPGGGYPASRPGSTRIKSTGSAFLRATDVPCWRTTWDWARPCKPSPRPLGSRVRPMPSGC